MQVIRANLSHIDQLAQLFDGYRVFYKQASDVAKAKAFLQERIQNNEPRSPDLSDGAVREPGNGVYHYQRQRLRARRRKPTQRCSDPEANTAQTLLWGRLLSCLGS